MAFTWLLTMLAAASPGWVVVEPVVNMFSKPSERSSVVSQTVLGTGVERIKRQGKWIRVRTPDDYTGWMPRASLRKHEAGPYAVKGRVAQVRSLFANLYRKANITRQRPLLTVPFETRLEVIQEPEEQDRRWIQVRLPDERMAWIQRGDVSFEERDLSIDEVIALSRRFVGLPYLWGGTSSFGYDCSGFTQMLYRRLGITMPRDSGPQASWEGMEDAPCNKLQPGDLLFFGESEQEITHTGMYMGGREFIHATAYLKPVVQISRLDDPHWSELLVACRRLK